MRIRSVGDELCCPICLEPPVAPQVTKCGHVFCFACLLHHAATAEKKWSTCPICFEMVYVEDLRSATLLPTPAVSVGDVLEMTLMTVVANPGLDLKLSVRVLKVEELVVIFHFISFSVLSLIPSSLHLLLSY